MYQKILKDKKIIKRNLIDLKESDKGIVCNVYNKDKARHLFLEQHNHKLFKFMFTNMIFATCIFEGREYIIHNIDFSNLHDKTLCVDLMPFSEDYIVSKKKIRVGFFSTKGDKVSKIKDFVLVDRAFIKDLLDINELIDVDVFNKRIIKSKDISSTFINFDLAKI